MASLTPAQRRVLASTARGNVRSMGFGESFFEDGRDVSAVVQRLKKAGLVETIQYGTARFKIRITEAGMTALEG